jgi:hypothetical protein
MNYDIFKEFSKFNNIKFYDEPHVYFIDDTQVISVTGLIHKFTDEFDEAHWLPIKAQERVTADFKLIGESDEQALERAKVIVKDEWTFKNRHGIYEGKLIHSYLENLMANKDIAEDKKGIDGIVTFPDIEQTFFMMKKLAYNFYVEYIQSGKLIPVKSELVVGAIELGLAGQIDQLFYNTELQCLQLFDWKTNRKLDLQSRYSMKHCLGHLDACEFNTYSLQLYTYKYLLEKNTGIKLHDKVNIVWFNEHNDNARIIECRDMTKEVQDMLEYKKNNEDQFKVRSYDRPGIPEYKVEQSTSMADLLNFDDPMLF